MAAGKALDRTGISAGRKIARFCHRQRLLRFNGLRRSRRFCMTAVLTRTSLDQPGGMPGAARADAAPIRRGCRSSRSSAARCGGRPAQTTLLDTHCFFGVIATRFEESRISAFAWFRMLESYWAIPDPSPQPSPIRWAREFSFCRSGYDYDYGLGCFCLLPGVQQGLDRG
jgi:hypothetical protein